MFDKIVKPRFPKLSGLLSQDKALETVNQSFLEYQDKTYLEENRAAIRKVSGAKILCHLISIALAITFVTTLIEGAFPDEVWERYVLGVFPRLSKIKVILFLTLALLIGLEMAKSSLFRLYMYKIQKKKQKAWGLLGVQVILLVLSVFFSVMGGVQLATHISTPTLVDLDAIDSQTQAQIGQEQNRTDAAIASMRADIEANRKHKVYDKGKWVVGWTERQNIKGINQAIIDEQNRLATRIGELSTSANGRKGRALAANTTAIQTSTQDTRFNQWVLGVISLLNEVFLILSMYFLARYRYIVYLESTGGLSIEPTVKDQSQQALYQDLGQQQTPSAVAAMQQQPPIGYKLRQTSQPSETARTVTVHPPSEGYEITCAHCQQPAQMRSSRAKYCSDTCRKAAYEKRTGKAIRV